MPRAGRAGLDRAGRRTVAEVAGAGNNPRVTHTLFQADRAGSAARGAGDSAPLRVLVIEDSPDDALLMMRVLRHVGLAVEWRRVDSPSALDAALAAGGWDLVTCDWVMPGLSPLDAMRRVRAHDPALPIVVVTGEAGEAIAVAARRAGACCCVSKDELPRLGPVVLGLRPSASSADGPFLSDRG